MKRGGQMDERETYEANLTRADIKAIRDGVIAMRRDLEKVLKIVIHLKTLVDPIILGIPPKEP